MKIDEKITSRFKQLIDFQVEVMKTRKQGSEAGIPPYDYVDNEIANQWALSCLHILRRVFGENSDHYSKFNTVFSKFPGTNSIRQALGILKAAKDDFENDYLFETRNLIEAEVFDDFLEQAKHLLASGYNGPAAVVAGIVLEDGLKKLCQRKGIHLSEKPKLDLMNAELTKAGTYNRMIQKRITALADIRNKAAHGNWSEFSGKDVEQMLMQVRSFIEDYLK